MTYPTLFHFVMGLPLGGCSIEFSGHRTVPFLPLSMVLGSGAFGGMTIVLFSLLRKSPIGLASSSYLSQNATTRSYCCSHVPFGGGSVKNAHRSSVKARNVTVGNSLLSVSKTKKCSAMSKPMLPMGHPILVPSLPRMIRTLVAPVSSL